MVNDEKKIKQIIEFEAKSAIPFEMHEVVWDSQLLNVADDNGEIEAMFVIVKSEEIERITALIESFGKQIALIEVAPTACYNAARLNGIGDDNCELILNIGDRCSSLLFCGQRPLFCPHHPDCRSMPSPSRSARNSESLTRKPRK